MMRVMPGGEEVVVAHGSGLCWSFRVRPGDAEALAGIRETWVEDVYGINSVLFSPTVRDDGSERPAVVLDLGAHVGAVAVRCALGGAHVIAVEPDPENAALLRWNTRDLAVAVVEGAAGRGEGTADLERIEGSSMVRTVPAGPVAGHVPMSGLGTFAPGEIALCKIDTEGAEYDILGGASDAALARIERFAVETHPTDPATWGAVVGRLARTHSVRAFGAPERGGMLYATRYPRPTDA